MSGEEAGRRSTAVPVTEATLCYIRDGRSVLLQRRPTGKLGASRLNGPGGKVDPHESPAEAVVREIHEETALHIEDPQTHGQLDFVFGQPEIFRLRVQIFSTRRYRGVLSATEGALVWYDEQSLPFEQMWPDNRYWVPFVLDGGNVDGECLFDERGDELLGMDVALRMGSTTAALATRRDLA